MVFLALMLLSFGHLIDSNPPPLHTYVKNLLLLPDTELLYVVELTSPPMASSHLLKLKSLFILLQWPTSLGGGGKVRPMQADNSHPPSQGPQGLS